MGRQHDPASDRALTLIQTAQDAEAVAEKLTSSPSNSARRTSISAGLEFAEDLFAESGFQGVKRVVDVSGDGPNNQGAPVTEIRDRLVGQGVVINGLPLMTNGAQFRIRRRGSRCVLPEMRDRWARRLHDPRQRMGAVPEAIRRKLVLELAGHSLPWFGRSSRRRVNRGACCSRMAATTA